MDNPEHPLITTVGCVAGIEENYKVFAEMFDKIIDDRHVGYKPGQKRTTYLDHTKISGGHFDPKYVLSSQVHTGRSIRGLSLPPIY